MEAGKKHLVVIFSFILIQFIFFQSTAVSQPDGEHRGGELINGQLLITKVLFSSEGSEIYIHGHRLNAHGRRHSSPRVTLGDTELAIISASANLIAAWLPTGLQAGDYLLRVSTGRGLQDNDSYALTVGSFGGQGEAGPPGPEGPPGPQDRAAWSNGTCGTSGTGRTNGPRWSPGSTRSARYSRCPRWAGGGWTARAGRTTRYPR